MSLKDRFCNGRYISVGDVEVSLKDRFCNGRFGCIVTNPPVNVNFKSRHGSVTIKSECSNRIKSSSHVLRNKKYDDVFSAAHGTS